MMNCTGSLKQIEATKTQKTVTCPDCGATVRKGWNPSSRSYIVRNHEAQPYTLESREYASEDSARYYRDYLHSIGRDSAFVEECMDHNGWRVVWDASYIAQEAN